MTDLARFLTAMGAEIEGIGTDVLTIHGVQALTPASYTIMSDRIEAGTYMAAAAITRGQVTITNAPVPHMSAVMGKFPEAGVRLTAAGNRITVEPGGTLTGVDIRPIPIPAFPRTCRPSTWPSCPWPRAPASSPKPSSKIASCTSANSSAWAPTSP